MYIHFGESTAYMHLMKAYRAETSCYQVVVDSACIHTLKINHPLQMRVQALTLSHVISPCPLFLCRASVNYTRAEDDQNSLADDVVDLIPNESDTED